MFMFLILIEGLQSPMWVEKIFGFLKAVDKPSQTTLENGDIISHHVSKEYNKIP